MSDTTTIELRDDQHESLEDLKEHPRESFKSVLDRLLADNDASESCPECGHDIGTEETCMTCEGERILKRDKLQEQLDRIESSASTVEERTGSIEKELEALRQ